MPRNGLGRMILGMLSELTRSQFIEHFPRLVVEARDLPKKALPLNVLLVSAMHGLEPGRRYPEAEVNAALQRWLMRFGLRFGLDHASLRRLLVDEGLLLRDSGGAWYEPQSRSRDFACDPAIRELDLEALVAEERARRAERKRSFSGKSGGDEPG